MAIVHQGTVEEGQAFLTRRWPGAPAISDPERRLYDAFGLGRGSVGQLFGPRVFAAAAGAVRYGVGLARPVGDPFVLAGAFVVDDRGVIHRAEPAAHAGSSPDFGALFAAARIVAAVEQAPDSAPST